MGIRRHRAERIRQDTELDFELYESKGRLRCIWSVYELGGCVRLKELLAHSHLTKLRVDKFLAEGWLEEVGGDYSLTDSAREILLPQILALKDYATRRKDS